MSFYGLGPGFPTHSVRRMARESLSIALDRASSCRAIAPPEYENAPVTTARPAMPQSYAGARPEGRAPAHDHGVTRVANTSVRLLVLALLACTKTDLNAVPLFASPW